jgi:hypothetical protein
MRRWNESGEELRQAMTARGAYCNREEARGSSAEQGWTCARTQLGFVEYDIANLHCRASNGTSR